MGQKSSKQKQPPWGSVPAGYYPPGGYGSNPPFIPPGFQPPPGMQYPPFAMPGQQGFIPPGVYGQAGMSMPPPQLAWMQNDKEAKKDRKGKRRAQSEQFPGGFVPGPNGPGFPQPNVPAPNNDGPVIPERRSSKKKSGRRRASTSASTSAANSRSGHPPPLTTPRGTGVPLNNFPPHDRVHTPFIPSRETDEDESYSSDTSDTDQPPPQRRRHAPRRSRSAGHPPPPVTGRIDDVLRPLPPAEQSAFGPSGTRPNVKLRNPLPDPPRDLYEMTPYKSLLTLPQTTALLTASYGTAQQQNANAIANTNATGGTATTVVIPPGGVGATIIPGGPQLQQQADLKKGQPTKKKGGMGGLLRSFSRKGKEKDKEAASTSAAPTLVIPQPAKVQFVPVFVEKKEPSGSSQQGHQARRPSGGSGSGDHSGNLDNSYDSRDYQNHNQQHHDDVRHDDRHDDHRDPELQHPPPETGPLEFDQSSRAYAGFMNHSPHRILYQNKMYPTATHLHEALKYLPDYPEMAERIRLVSNVLEVYPMSASMEQHQRDDWADVFLGKMEEVLLHKFMQHADLRDKLVSETGNRMLVYADVLDGFWGLGPDGNGQNQLGNVLMNVRERLRREGGLR